MKRVAASFFVAFAFSSVVFAQQDTSKSVVTSQDSAAVQKGVQELGKLFNVEAPKSAVQQAASAVQAPQEKTIADVMDKAIDKVSDVVGMMASAINKVAPDVWRIMIKQQYAKAFGGMIVPAIFCLLVYFILVRKSRTWKKQKHDEVISAARKDGISANARDTLINEEGSPRMVDTGRDPNPTEYGAISFVHFASWVVFCIGFLWFANRLSESSVYLINPEYYAIQDILRMLLTRTVQ